MINISTNRHVKYMINPNYRWLTPGCYNNGVKKDNFTLANISLFSLNFVNISLFVIIFQQHFNKNINNSCYNPSLPHSKWKKNPALCYPRTHCLRGHRCPPSRPLPGKSMSKCSGSVLFQSVREKKSIVPIQSNSNPRNRPN